MKSILDFLYVHFVTTALLHTHNIRVAMLTILFDLGDVNPETPEREVTTASKLRLIRAFVAFTRSDARLPAPQYFLSISQAAKDAVAVALGFARRDLVVLKEELRRGAPSSAIEEMMILDPAEWHDVWLAVQMCAACEEGCLPLLHDRRNPHLLSKQAVELFQIVTEIVNMGYHVSAVDKRQANEVLEVKGTISKSKAKRVRSHFVAARRTMWHSDELRDEVTRHAEEWLESFTDAEKLPETPSDRSLLIADEVRLDLGQPRRIDPVSIALGNGGRGRNSVVTEKMSPTEAARKFVEEQDTWKTAYLVDHRGKAYKAVPTAVLEAVEFTCPKQGSLIAKVHVDFSLVEMVVS